MKSDNDEENLTVNAANTSNKSESESFSTIITELVKWCDDYEVLKTIQSSTSVINDLFTCPSQSIWKQLCARSRFTMLLKRESKSIIKRSKLVWESIYYQNWRVNFNWMNNKYALHDISASFGGKEAILMKMINTAIGISIVPRLGQYFDVSEVTLWDLKRGNPMEMVQVRGQVTCTALKGNKLAFGMACGSIQISTVLCNEKLQEGSVVKIHSKGVSSIVIEKDFIVSADVGGQILSFPIKFQSTDSPIVLFDGQSSGITSLLVKGQVIYAATQDGSLISINRAFPNPIVKRETFSESGSINCILEFDGNLYLGADSGDVIRTNWKGKRISTFRQGSSTSSSPIVCMATDLKKRIAVGQFNGAISILSMGLKSLKSSSEHVSRNGPIWSLGIDEVSLLSSSINGQILLYNYSYSCL